MVQPDSVAHVVIARTVSAGRVVYVRVLPLSGHFEARMKNEEPSLERAAEGTHLVSGAVSLLCVGGPAGLWEPGKGMCAHADLCGQGSGIAGGQRITTSSLRGKSGTKYICMFIDVHRGAFWCFR